ncbi:pSer/pThr/pTyr-binding forkhead associated (FHA) protein [Anaerosolibacter carboniphilus]|uniref:PSer/pThr/pTyr-binding forkhead associated (FHA) protein n=1 Tax=Anaerosolibacter carboniphilus TaxID=1417629 RepID=A0A841KRA1_9FIRM|nr:FHA domain-containing protein [Anaerosolibacter carboniphilus]MBB6216274.1 pSer/pThr/pTyr-binding forkhead associated (FHA) protein [Anaerosolibacter carboniphilus]
MFNVLSLVFRYLFILLIYLFMFGIIRLIYMDIKNINGPYMENNTYLKLINRKDTLPFKVKEVYNLQDSITVGRGNDNDIVIKDPYISNKHIKIALDESEYFLEDLDSANGTYLNSDRVLDVVKLKNGDRIKLGQLEFLYVSND